MWCYVLVVFGVMVWVERVFFFVVCVWGGGCVFFFCFLFFFFLVSGVCDVLLSCPRCLSCVFVRACVCVCVCVCGRGGGGEGRGAVLCLVWVVCGVSEL